MNGTGMRLRRRVWQYREPSMFLCVASFGILIFRLTWIPQNGNDAWQVVPALVENPGTLWLLDAIKYSTILNAEDEIVTERPLRDAKGYFTLRKMLRTTTIDCRL